jgi:hypothetical protein
MTGQRREEFWRRFHAEIERFRESETSCEVAINPFEVGRWHVKFTERRAGYPAASVAIGIIEHSPSKDEFLLAITPTYVVEDVVTEGERLLIPVFVDPASDAFLLHADHGPVAESDMTRFFARTAGALLDRL